ncbi:MAG: spore cortex biosynthesis protein YabQ [Oscillospiraceae bacterium]|nr:spore cortex biosynthesis protein YabQ [Oscillospiraceae bacterium]
MFEPISENLSQLSAFVVVGFFFAALYEIIRIIRLFKRQSDFVVCLTDFLFLSFAGLITFAYSMEFGEGRFRWFYIAGEIFGATVYFMTIGRAVSIASDFIVRSVKRTAALIIKYTKRLLTAVIKYVLIPLYKIIRIFSQYSWVKISNIYVFLTKIVLNLINRLKNKVRIVYNKRTARKVRAIRDNRSDNLIAGDNRNVIKGEVRNAATTKKTAFGQVRKA